MTETIRMCCGRILAGCSVALGAFIYLKVGGALGACMFSVGLMSVLTFGFSLFTGQIRNFRKWKKDLPWLTGVLLFNIIGCVLASLLVQGDAQIVDACRQIVMRRAALGFFPSIATGAGCGFIMTLTVTAWKDSPWPLLIGIPAFILAGLTHSVADAFYYAVGWQALSSAAMLSYVGTVIGNFIGGILFKAGSTLRK